MEKTKQLIIFISSPGDVQEERIIADRVIRKLQKEYNSVVELVPIMWENLPLTSTRTFQEGIDAVLVQQGVDIAVFLLGNRLGSSPGNNYLHPDGENYKSGTEYEYDFMQQMYQQSGRPEMLVYIKMQSEKELLKRYSSLSEAKDASFQNELLKQFIQERFEDKNLGAYLAYHKITDDRTFETRLTEHLRSLLQKLLGNISCPRYVGNPYKGLLAFEKKDEYIFFGRNQEIQTLEKKILEHCLTYNEIPFVFVCGQSGSGKSSLIKAGLLPDIETTGLGHNSYAVINSITPQQFSGNIFSGILDFFKTILPELGSNKYFNALYQMEDIYLQDVAIIDNAISRKSESDKQFIPVFFFDQFEEFFTDSRIGSKEKYRCKKLLAALQQTGKIMFIFCLRSDFYHFLTDDNDLLEIRKNSVVWDISPLSASELKDIIEEPARMAGISWEKDPVSGKMLCSQILDDAVKLQCLPLLEFALSTLYDNRKNDVMTFAYYRQSGGITGAIATYANAVFNDLDNKQKAIFFKLLSMAVSVADDGTFCRRDSVIEEYHLSDAEQTVLNIMIEKRLFYTSRNSQNQAVFSIVHEYLINNWDIVKSWIQRENELIIQQKYFEEKRKRWEEHEQNSSYLITGNTDINDANDLLFYRERNLPRYLSEYLRLSIKHVSGRWKWGSVILFVLWNALCIFLPYIRPAISMSPWTLINTELFFVFLVFRKFYTVPFYKKIYLECLLSGILSLSIGSEIICYYNREDIAGGDWQFGVFGGCIYLFLNSMYKIIKYHSRKRKKSFFQPPGRIKSFLEDRGPFLLWIFFFSSLFIVFVIRLAFFREQMHEIKKAFAANDFLKVNQLLLKDSQENQFLENLASGSTSLYIDAKLYYDQMLPLKALDTGFGKELTDDLDKFLYYQISVDMNKGHEKASLAYTSPFIPPWTKVWIALSYGDIKKAAELAKKLPVPSSNHIAPEVMNYAHWLLLIKKDAKQALQIYKKHLHKTNGHLVWNNELLYDFVRLKKYEKFKSAVLSAEKELGLEPIPVLPGPGINIAKELPLLHGKWELVNKDSINLQKNVNLFWEIDLQSKIPSYYNWIDTSGGKEKLLGRNFSYLKINKLNDKVFLLEEYSPRTNATSSALLKFINNDILAISILFNGNPGDKKQVRYYCRIKQKN